MFRALGIKEEVYTLCEEALADLRDRFAEIDSIAEYNQLKVVKAFQDAHVSEAHLYGTTGYGYDDIGRDTLEQVYANVFGTEDALVRSQITSGPHPHGIALAGSLAEYGITYRQVDLLPDGGFDYDGIRAAINERTHLVEIQRSKGYASRDTFSPESIGELIAFVKSIKPDVICMVDNCYGEFTRREEPSLYGADMVVGSLIKNPGGGLAPLGGYIAGTKDCVERAAVRLTTPGLGKEVGASLDNNKLFYQGLFMSPVITANAEKTAIFAAKVYERLGFQCHPSADTTRYDIIQAITLGSEEAMVAFCQGIQAAAPIDSFVTPYPDDMPGYDSKVIMAAGAFVQGSSIELSADGPIRAPYNVYFQGGLTWYHGKLGIMMSVQKMLEKGLITI